MPDDLQKSAPLCELDLRLINTLQIDPRAPWKRIAQALEIDPVTAARHWQRLTDSGAAWITAQLSCRAGQLCRAFVELDCEAGRALEVAAVLADWPHVLTIEHTSGDRDLLLTIAVPDLAALSRYAQESMGAVPGVLATRIHLVSHVHAQGCDWQLGTLDADQRGQLGTGDRNRQASRGRELTELDKQLIRHLGADGRRSLTALADDVGLSISTVRRRLDDLLTSKDLILRCEIAQSLSGWPVTTWLWGQVPADDREVVPALLRAVPEIRACASLTGSKANLCISVWTRSLEDTRALESRVARLVPQFAVLDRTVVLRFVKRMGRVLDPLGRTTRVVPMDIWADPVATR
ncbi:Lrp/AsnC family transcriptional regulator [Saccharopolyspora sp. WRP15-2]|uniref:Lrp/AsnC family transcriptional regulator n=1 Tax=Saccharopolyspora oryzae TaxID=2997343 RepID=A0ABT4V0J4_9PSEU|nr:Lrp/AsnC family transcriptional regulator [Saccharopolyspora oryzae]MDA3626956.1 Lrp/AsnC family transcriptional regulator [Saccharopolyspora oryzae]